MSRLGTYIVGGVAAAFSAGVITAVALGQGDDGSGDDAFRRTINQQVETATAAPNGTETFTATPDDSGDNRQSPPESTNTPATSQSQGSNGGELQTFDAREAGTVTVRIDGRNVTLESVAANPGWEWREDVDDDEDRDEVEVYFQSGDTRIKIEVEHDDGRIKHEVETESRRSGSDTWDDDHDRSDDDDHWDDD